MRRRALLWLDLLALASVIVGGPIDDQFPNHLIQFELRVALVA